MKQCFLLLYTLRPVYGEETTRITMLLFTMLDAPVVMREERRSPEIKAKVNAVSNVFMTGWHSDCKGHWINEVAICPMDSFIITLFYLTLPSQLGIARPNLHHDTLGLQEVIDAMLPTLPALP